SRWCAGGRVVVLDDGRPSLPRALPPGEEASVQLKVTPPPVAGPYELQIDMVEEGITWFANHGSQPATVPVKVQSSETASGTLLRRLGLRPLTFTGDDCLPVAEMHCVPEEQVRAVVAGAGGEVVDAAAYNVTGPIDESLRYVAVRR